VSSHRGDDHRGYKTRYEEVEGWRVGSKYRITAVDAKGNGLAYASNDMDYPEMLAEIKKMIDAKIEEDKETVQLASMVKNALGDDNATIQL